jgi:hypothetical protein
LADRYARAVTTDEQPAAVTPALASAEPRRSHRVRNLVLIVVAFVLVMGGLAAGTAFYFYDKATAIDRSTPQITTEQFLNATLVQKDLARTSLFICGSWTAEEAMAEAAAPTDPRIEASWGDFVASINGSDAMVTTRVVFRAKVNGGPIQQEVQMWQLSLKNEDGWRVCGLTKQDESLEP